METQNKELKEVVEKANKRNSEIIKKQESVETNKECQKAMRDLGVDMVKGAKGR